MDVVGPVGAGAAAPAVVEAVFAGADVDEGTGAAGIIGTVAPGVPAA